MAETGSGNTAIAANTIAGNVDTAGFVRQIVQIGDGTANAAHVGPGGEMYESLTSPAAAVLGIFGMMNPYGTQRVTVEPTPVFFDPFDGVTIDTTNRWATAGTQVPTQANGQVTLAPTVGASVANNSTLISQPTFVSPGIGFMIYASTVTLEAAQTSVVNVNRFWGKGQVTSFAYTTPVTDGIGFEVEGTVGALQCVIYIGGTKYVVNSTNSALVSSSVGGAGGSGTAFPSGATGSNYGSLLTWKGGQHRYAIFVRSDVIYWFVEGTEVPVAVLSYGVPNVQGMPLRFHSITNNAATSLANTFTVGATAVADTTAQNHTLSDGTYSWRKAKVDSFGSQAVAMADATTGTAVSSTAPLQTGLWGPVTHGNPQAVVNPLGGVYQYRRGPLVISDMFDPAGGIDTNRWLAGGTAPPAIVAYSGLTFTTGTTTNTSSKIVSVANFNQVTSSEVVMPVTLETTLTTNNHRFWGFGTEPAVWAAATPIQDGWGFEVTTGGQLRAVVYSNGTAISSANLSTPAAGSHTYQMIYRIGAVYFYVDGLRVTNLNGLPLSIESMNVRMHSINATSNPGLAPTFVVAGAVARDGENLISQIADPIYQHRRARVTAAGEQRVSLGVPVILQKKSSVSSGSVASQATTFNSGNVSGGTIIVTCAVGNVTQPTIADSAGNTYNLVKYQAVGAAAGVAVFVAAGIASNPSNTVTVTNAGATASMATEVYEVDALLNAPLAVVDASVSATATSTTPATAALSPISPNELLIFAVGVGTAAQTITPAAGWTNDSGQLNPTTPAGLFSFASFSQFAGATTPITPTSTIVSEPWTAVAVAFRPVMQGVEGSVRITDGTSNAAVKAASTAAVATDQAVVVAISPNNTVPVSLASNISTPVAPTAFTLNSAATTNATSVKGSSAKVFQITCSNQTAAAKFVKIYNKASAPTVGTDLAALTICLPAQSATVSNVVVVSFGTLGMLLGTGFALAITGAVADSDATAVAVGDVKVMASYI